MLTLIPCFAFASLAAGFHFRNRGWRESAVLASIPWTLFLVVLTELLTQLHALTRIGVALGWMTFAMIGFGWMISQRRRLQAEIGPPATAPLLAADEKIFLSAMGLLAVLIGLSALISAPNNWDAMEYHLPRVVMWINQRGVQFYPTVDWFQLDQPPLAEYGMLHLYLLYGSDRLVALVQWLAYVGCVVSASLVAKELGGDRRTQAVAAVLAAAIPSAILGASSTKNDCVLAYWIAVTVYLALRWRRIAGWTRAYEIGTAAGLALFTKGTAYLFLPSLLLACSMAWGRHAWRSFLIRLPLVIAMIAVICGPLWIRNYRFSGSPLGIPYFRGNGSVENRRFQNDHFSPAQVGADVLRNLALNIGVPGKRINEFSQREISRFIALLGVDPNEPGQISYRQSGEPLDFRVSFDPFDEFFSEDPAPLLLFLLACGLVAVHWRRTRKDVRWLAAGLITAYVVYCALLRWAPSNERYVIPLIVLGSSFAAVVLTNELPRNAVNVLAGLALAIGFPLAVFNQTRPLLTRHGLQGSILTTPRDATYFFDNHQQLAKPFLAGARAARASDCRSIGIDADLLHFEYPMMALLSEDGGSRQVRYVGVENSTARYKRTDDPGVCAVLCLGCLHHPEKMVEYATRFPTQQAFGTLIVFRQNR